MNEKQAKLLRRFSEIQGTSYRRNKKLFSSAKGPNRHAISVMINKVVEEAEKKAV
jgi:hypothetical protein